MNDYVVRIPQQLPGLLAVFRKHRGMTQAQVATRMGVTQQTVPAMERSAEKVSAGRLLKMLGILRVELVLRECPENSPSHLDVETDKPHWREMSGRKRWPVLPFSSEIASPSTKVRTVHKRIRTHQLFMSRAMNYCGFP